MTEQYINKLADELLSLTANAVGAKLEEIEKEHGKEKMEQILKAMFRSKK